MAENFNVVLKLLLQLEGEVYEQFVAASSRIEFHTETSLKGIRDADKVFTLNQNEN